MDSVLLSPFAVFAVAPAAEAAFAAASCAFSSRNWRYVLVFGTVSDKNSRLSILDIAVAWRLSELTAIGLDNNLPISLYAKFFRGFRSDLTTVCDCSARYRIKFSYRIVNTVR